MDTMSGEQRDGLDDFLHNIETNTRQYIKLFAEAADIAMPAPNRNDIPNDVFDVLLEQVVSDTRQVSCTCASSKLSMQSALLNMHGTPMCRERRVWSCNKRR